MREKARRIMNYIFQQQIKDRDLDSYRKHWAIYFIPTIPSVPSLILF